jgi:FdhE protein
MSRSSWERRIERAGELEKECPAAAEVLRFYQEIARFQKDVQPKSTGVQDLLPYVPPLLALVRRTGPTALAAAAERLSNNRQQWPNLFDSPPDPAHFFFARVLLQPFTESAALRFNVSTSVTRNTCPFCAEWPVTAVLRPEGEGGKRGLLCSLCFTEWEFRRLLCPNCGEEDHQKLPVYKTPEFPYVRVEACDSCRHYLKAIDLTINGLAVPEVDELASIPLDMWALEKDYVKLAPNLLGF